MPDAELLEVYYRQLAYHKTAKLFAADQVSKKLKAHSESSWHKIALLQTIFKRSIAGWLINESECQQFLDFNLYLWSINDDLQLFDCAIFLG